MKRIIPTILAVVAMISGVYFFLNTRQNTTNVEAENNKLHIVTTNSILEDMVKNVEKTRLNCTVSSNVGLIRMNTNHSRVMSRLQVTQI